MSSHWRLRFFNIACCSIWYWLMAPELNAARASLPPESLQFQSFESYPDKKGGWYSDNVKHYQIKNSTQAAFRGQKGVQLTGVADGQLLVFRLPLNPENGGARKIRSLLAHRGRFMLRSNCRGVVRYILRAKDGRRLYSPWMAFHSSPSESLKAKNPESYLTQTWAAHWQQVELPNFKPFSHDYKTEDGQLLILKEEVEPEALDFRCRGEVGSFDLHVDEFNIDINHLMNYKSKAYEKMPLINVSRTFPRPSNLFSSPEYLKILQNEKQGDTMKPSFEWKRNVFKEPELCWSGSKSLKIQPKLPLYIATDRGVVGLRVGLRSTGTRVWKLKLVFSEEKLRKAKDGREPHEIFATQLPLDFRGLRYFEIPLCFTGLPLRSNYRLHNKQIDGRLKLETLSIEPVIGNRELKDDKELKVSFVKLEQWVEREVWDSSMAAYPSKKFPNVPNSNSFLVKAWPYVLKDMESPDTFNATFKNNEQTWVEEFDLNKTAAMRGRQGLAIKLAPESKMTEDQNLEATFYFKSTHLPLINPEGEFQLSIRGRTTHTSRVSLWLKDDLGQIFSSPFKTFYEQKKKSKRLRNTIEWIDFAIADTSLKSYQVESKDPQVIPKLPYRPYALQIQVPNAHSKVNLHFDDLAVWTPISKPHLWRLNYRTTSPFFIHGQSSEFFSRDIFCSSDAWSIRHAYISKPNLDTGLPDQIKIKESLLKAEQRFRQAEEKLALVKKLDPKSTKIIDDYFKGYQCSPIEGVEAKILHFNTDPSGMELSLYWNNQRVLNTWEKWGCSGISLESEFWNGHQNSEELSWIPVADGVMGMVLTIWNSAHLDTYLRLIFIDERNRYFVRHIALDQAGIFSHHLAFSKESFRILSKAGRYLKDQEEPQRLRLLRAELEHVPLTPKHTGEQNLKLFPIKWLVDRKKMPTAFKE